MLNDNVKRIDTIHWLINKRCHPVFCIRQKQWQKKVTAPAKDTVTLK